MTLIKYHKGKFYAIEGLGKHPKLWNYVYSEEFKSHRENNPNLPPPSYEEVYDIWQTRFNWEGVEVLETVRLHKMFSKYIKRDGFTKKIIHTIKEGDYILSEVEIKENRAYLK